jgi:hypothetical protein
VLQCRSVQILHDDKGLPVHLVNLVDGANVRVVQRRGGFGFTLKAGERLRVSADIIRKEFECDRAIEFYVFGLVDNTHSPTTELFDDTVMRDGLPEQR